MKYFIKNCPAYEFCACKSVKYAPDCLLKQIVAECEKIKNFYGRTSDDYLFGRLQFAYDILAMMEIVTLNKNAKG